MKIIYTIVLLSLICASNAFADWERVEGSSAGAIDSYGSPVVEFTYEFTATEADTIDALSLVTAGGCITWIDIDLLTPTPDSITTTLKNSRGITVTGPSTSALTADGNLYQSDTGNPLCLAKGFYYTFTGTIAVGDKFRIITEVLVDK